MPKTIKTRRLEFDKSTFIIDLVKHDNKQLCVNIKQTILEEKKSSLHHEIKINPEVLKDLLIVLNTFQNFISIEEKATYKPKRFTADQQTSIINSYLKGVEIEDLTLLFSCDKRDIHYTLRKHDIPIVSNKLPK